MKTFQTSLTKEIYNFTAKFNTVLSKPHQGNMRELLMGMMISESVLLSNIGEVAGRGVTPRKNSERYANALSTFDTSALHNRHIEVQAYQYRDEPVLLLCDGGDMQKPHAQQMEGVSATIDGSNGHRVGKGYPTWCVTAYGVNTKKSMPLAYHLYSRREEHFKGEWSEQKSILDLLTPFTTNAHDRIIVEDRGGDDVKRFSYYTQELQVSFITRINTGGNARGVVVNPQAAGYREIMNMAELAESMRAGASHQKKYFHKKLKKEILSTIAWKGIELPQKEMNGVALQVVVVYTDHFKQPMVLLTDQKVESSEDAWQIFFWYKKRWEVEDFFRATKQEFNAEKFLIRNLKAIKGLVFVMMLATAFLRKLAQQMERVFGMIFQAFQHYCKRWQKKKEQYLDVLDWIKQMWRQAQSKQDSYRHRPQKRQWRRLYLNHNQNTLFPRKKSLFFDFYSNDFLIW